MSQDLDDLRAAYLRDTIDSDEYETLIDHVLITGGTLLWQNGKPIRAREVEGRREGDYVEMTVVPY